MQCLPDIIVTQKSLPTIGHQGEEIIASFYVCVSIVRHQIKYAGCVLRAKFISSYATNCAINHVLLLLPTLFVVHEMHPMLMPSLVIPHARFTVITICQHLGEGSTASPRSHFVNESDKVKYAAKYS